MPGESKTARFLKENYIMSKTGLSSARLEIIVAFVAYAAFSMGCNKDHNISDRQEVLFQYDYNNSAWGFQHYGFIIDNKGEVITYNNPKDWNYPDKSYIITEKQIAENLQKCELSGIKIPMEELHKYTNYIRNISSSMVSAKQNVANDAGTTEFICYRYLESTGAYEGHLIKMEGDYKCENLNFYSKKVASWMRAIGNNIYLK